MKNIFLFALAAVFLWGCKPAKNGPAKDILAANLDTTVSPGEDFFQYANGGWLKNNSIPASESGWGIGNLVEEEIYNRLRKINEDAAKSNAEKGSITRKIGDFWSSAMDTAALEREGLTTLKEALGKINAIQTASNVLEVTAYLQMRGVDCLFSNYIGQDDMNSEVMAFILYQGGLGMPNRDYYFNTDDRTVSVRKAYKEYLVKTFRQLGDTDNVAVKNAEDIIALETRLAKSSRTREALRDPYENYNKMAVTALNKSTPNINWTNFTQLLGINKLDTVIVGQPEFYTALSTELVTTPVTVWKNYLRFHTVKNYAGYLDNETFNNNFEYSKTLSGATEPRPRWKRVLDSEEEAMGEALGQLFAKEYFDEKAKKRYSDLVEAVREAYKDRILQLTWMSDSTKQNALKKLAKITKKVGYPDKWKDFSQMSVSKGPYLLNMQRAYLWWHNYSINKLGKPVDRTEWDMTPQTYNAYYSPSNNEIVLPAGIFAVPGYRDEELDDALVYGYAGASTIGHELTHGFDDQGRQYDAYGNLANWWSANDEKEFNLRAQSIIRQFNEFMPVDSLRINGTATQGENIADLGGMLIGLDAFKKTDMYKKGEKIGGLTPLQRYFLGYALGWMYQVKKERLANQVITGVHSPPKERVNGPVVNIPEFYEAFDIKPGDKMFRPDSLRVFIW